MKESVVLTTVASAPFLMEGDGEIIDALSIADGQ